MKLRLRGNTLRLRLTRSEVDRVGAGGCVEEVTAFGPRPADRLTYAVESSVGADRVCARLVGARITVELPAALAAAWATTERVALSAEQPITGSGDPLTILVEKDFACLDRRDEDADAFPHPGDARC